MRTRLTRSHRKTLFISLAVVIAVAALVIGYLVFQSSQAEDDPFVAPETSNTQDTASDEPEPAPTPDSTPDESSDTPEQAPALDPATVSTVDIEPLGITVSYVRGVPGFSFVVLRTQSGTEYVEFRSEDVEGTRCTDDEGAFASIIVGPSEQDIPTLAQTVTLEETVYGLSLPDATCTNDETLFNQYQDSFRDAFTLLDTIETE